MFVLIEEATYDNKCCRTVKGVFAREPSLPSAYEEDGMCFDYYIEEHFLQ